MSVKARAEILLEIDCTSTWGDDTTVAQVRAQAMQNASDTINKVVNAANTQLRIIGDIQIKIITFDVNQG